MIQIRKCRESVTEYRCPAPPRRRIPELTTLAWPPEGEDVRGRLKMAASCAHDKMSLKARLKYTLNQENLRF